MFEVGKLGVEVLVLGGYSDVDGDVHIRGTRGPCGELRTAQLTPTARLEAGGLGWPVRSGRVEGGRLIAR